MKPRKRKKSNEGVLTMPKPKNVREILEKYRLGIVHYRIKSMRFTQDQALSSLAELVRGLRTITIPEGEVLNGAFYIDKVEVIFKSDVLKLFEGVEK